jgi:sporulation protein YlmC with PRC-barrel domain
MKRLRLSAWLATIGAMLLFAAPALAQDQAKDQPAPTGTAHPAPKLVAPPVAAKPQPPAKAQAATKPATPPAPRHVDTPKQEADSLLGKEVYGADGAQMGLVTNVLVDRAGHPIALVIDFGGFLGVGSRKVAVDWKLMHFYPGNSKKPVTLSLSKEQLKAAPEYRSDKAAPVVQAPKPVPAKPGGVKPASAKSAPAQPAPAATPAPPPASKDQQEAKPATTPPLPADHTAPK